jgi:predicted O-methyltransferase YrrM
MCTTQEKNMQGDAPSREAVLSSLPQPFRSALLSMYVAEPQQGEDGQMHALEGNTGLSPSAGIWIYELCRRTRPLATLEIGLAYGFSTIYFLAGLQEYRKCTS